MPTIKVPGKVQYRTEEQFVTIKKKRQSKDEQGFPLFDENGAAVFEEFDDQLKTNVMQPYWEPSYEREMTPQEEAEHNAELNKIKENDIRIAEEAKLHAFKSKVISELTIFVHDQLLEKGPTHPDYIAFKCQLREAFQEDVLGIQKCLNIPEVVNLTLRLHAFGHLKEGT